MVSFESILLSLVSAIVGGLVVAFANHWMTQKREMEKKTTDVRVEYLIDCWMKIERAASMNSHSSKDYKNKCYDDLETAIAKITLLGDPGEVEAAKKFARDLAANSNASVNELLNSLRNSLRVKLGIAPAGALDLFFRMRRDKA